MLTQALNVTLQDNGVSLRSSVLWIEERRDSGIETKIEEGPRIGVEYAKEHALLPWRFWYKETL